VTFTIPWWLLEYAALVVAGFGLGLLFCYWRGWWPVASQFSSPLSAGRWAEEWADMKGKWDRAWRATELLAEQLGDDEEERHNWTCWARQRAHDEEKERGAR
jgi:hypothetical protein